MHKCIRRAIALLLSVCIAACPLSMAVWAAEEPLLLTVAADTHYQCAADLSEPSDKYTEYMLDKETFGYASTQGQMPYESDVILRQMLSEFIASDSEYLLIAGDLTCGKRQSHLAFAAHLRQAEQRSGKHIYVIIGNHDCYAQSDETHISMQEFREIYADFGYNEALVCDTDSASYAVDLNDRYRLLAIDSCIYGEDEGRITQSVFRFIRGQVKRAAADGKELIAMMHHSLLPHYALQPMIPSWRFYAGWFAANGIQTVLTGHIHANDIASSVFAGKTIYDIQTGALISSPNTYRTLTLYPDKTQVESHFITRIDTDLLPEYLTETQKAMLQEDFASYAKAYFESGVCKWMNRNLGSVDRLVRWFKLKEGTTAYDAAQRLMTRLGAAVGQDIYDTGSGRSIEETLRRYAIPIEKSAYTKPYQIAAKIMYGFFHGDEDAIGNEADTRLLLRCVEGALLSAMQSESDPTALDALIGSVVENAAAMPPSVAMRQCAEKTAFALVQTLADGFTEDYSAPEDLQVVLTYNEKLHTTPLSLLVTIVRAVYTFFVRLIRSVW
ncbi:MAG: metallophosphoesterase [Clostridia bacterium]|nr:metallophosphoesterase [Clostridia bacterium]